MVADIALCRHSASACSIPVVASTRSANARREGTELGALSPEQVPGIAPGPVQ